MTATLRSAGPHAVTAAPAVEAFARRTHPLRRSAIAVGAVAATANTLVVLAARAAGVSFEVGGESIPLVGFAQLTFVGAVVGALLVALLNRRAAHPRSRFVAIASVLVAVSCIPSVAMPSDHATRLALVATHLLAAAIIVPVLARHARG